MSYDTHIPSFAGHGWPRQEAVDEVFVQITYTVQAQYLVFGEYPVMSTVP